MKIKDIIFETVDPVRELDGQCEYYCRIIEKNSESLDIILIAGQAKGFLFGLSEYDKIVLELAKPKYYIQLKQYLNMPT